jgi:tRNA-Thr(GGU) m(6)t(6)A37 methyltransferase TsaA
VNDLTLHPVGWVRSPLKARKGAPRQGYDGAPAARIEVEPRFLPALHRLQAGDEVIVLTWLHQARRETLQVHPRGDEATPLTGVFATRSPDRPNPIGLHRLRVTGIAGNVLDVEPLEAIDGTPVVDIKPVLRRSEER